MAAKPRRRTLVPKPAPAIFNQSNVGGMSPSFQAQRTAFTHLEDINVQYFIELKYHNSSNTQVTIPPRSFILWVIIQLGCHYINKYACKIKEKDILSAGKIFFIGCQGCCVIDKKYRVLTWIGFINMDAKGFTPETFTHKDVLSTHNPVQLSLVTDNQYVNNLVQNLW